MCKIYIYYIYLCLNELYYRSECVVYAFCLNKTIYYIISCNRNLCSCRHELQMNSIEQC